MLRPSLALNYAAGTLVAPIDLNIALPLFVLARRSIAGDCAPVNALAKYRRS